MPFPGPERLKRQFPLQPSLGIQVQATLVLWRSNREKPEKWSWGTCYLLGAWPLGSGERLHLVCCFPLTEWLGVTLCYAEAWTSLGLFRNTWGVLLLIIIPAHWHNMHCYRLTRMDGYPILSWRDLLSHGKSFIDLLPVPGQETITSKETARHCCYLNHPGGFEAITRLNCVLVH